MMHAKNLVGVMSGPAAGPAALQLRLAKNPAGRLAQPPHPPVAPRGTVSAVRRGLWSLKLLSFFLALLANLSLLHAEVTKEEKRFFDFGQKAMEDRLFELAETQFQQLLSQYPRSEYAEEAAYHLAKARLNQGRWSEALELLEKRLPTTSAGWQDRYFVVMGECQLKGELPAAAFKTFESLISRFPKSKLVWDARYGMARALMQEQKFDGAQELLKKIQKDGPGELATRASLSLGISLFKQKKYDAALELLRRLAEEEKNRPVGFLSISVLGEIDLERKQTDAGRARFEMLSKSNRAEAQSVVPSAFFRLGQLDAAANSLTAAAGNFEQAFRRSDDTSLRLQCVDELTNIYLKLKKVDALADKFRSWADENARSRLGEALLLQVCTLWQRAGESDQAIRSFQIFLEKYPDGQFNDRAHFQLGWVFLDDKKYESATAEFQKAADRARQPQMQADAFLKLGDLHMDRQQFDSAATFYLKSSQVKGADAAKVEQALYQAANASLRAGNLEQVFKLQVTHGSQFAGGKLAPEFLLLAADANRRSGDAAQVAESYKTLLDKYPGSTLVPKASLAYAEALYVLGKSREEISSSSNEALEVIRNFLENFQNHELAPRVLFARGRHLERLEQLEKAVVVFKALVKEYPKSTTAVEAEFWLGSYYYRVKNYAQAQEAFELLRRSHPTHPLVPDATYFAALSAYKLGQNKDDASHLIESLVKEHPNSPWVFEGRFLYGDILSDRGDYRGALLAFEDLTKTYDAGKSPQMAERILEAHGRRGECLRQLKRMDEALAAFTLIVDSPKADTALRNQAFVEAGKTYENMDDFKHALENYIAPLYEKNTQGPGPESPEFFWICKGGLEASRLLEGQKNWKGAVRVLKRMIELNLPCSQKAEERLKQLQKDHADANL